MKSDERCRRDWENRIKNRRIRASLLAPKPENLPEEERCCSDKEATLFDSLEDKDVVIVGPAGYLQGQNRGEWIDSFDIVVRINHAVPIAFPEDYGTRTDVLYHILSHRNPEVKHKTLIDREEVSIWKGSGVGWLVSRHEESSKRIRDVRALIEGQLPWCCIQRSFYLSLKKKIGKKSPNTGVVAIMHLLSAKIKSLTIIGFDMYASGVYKGYGDIRPDEDASQVNARWHSTDDHINFMREVIQKDKRIQIDNHLREILRL